MNNLCNSRESFKIMEWETSYSTFKITSAFRTPTTFSGNNCTSHQINIYFVCGTNQIRRYTLIQSNVLHFEELGMICSFWREEESTSKYRPNTWVQLNNLPYDKQTIHPGLIAASRLALFSNYLSSTDGKLFEKFLHFPACFKEARVKYRNLNRLIVLCVLLKYTAFSLAAQ